MKNIIIDGIAGVAFVSILLFASGMNSENLIIPMVGTLGSLGVLALAATARGAWNI